MKNVALFFFAVFILVYMGCGSEEETSVSIRMTNPQGIAVPFYGYYRLSTAVDSALMEGNTNDEYNFNLSSGESIEGWVYKDTTDVIDTLHVQMFVNGEEEMSEFGTSMIDTIPFSLTAP